MNVSIDLDPRQLDRTVSVTQLTALLAASERRYAAMTKSFRWLAILIIAGVISAASVGFSLMDVAVATNNASDSADEGRRSACNPMDPASMRTKECAFEQVSNFFFKMNHMMEGMMASEDVIRGVASHNPDVYAASRTFIKVSEEIKQFHKENPGKPISKELIEKRVQEIRKLTPLLMEDFPSVAGQIVVDFAVLVKRLREDSDDFRNYLYGNVPNPSSPIGMVARELRLMNGALAAVPAMATQMDLMNRNMASMTHSMGSTMGRMGSWMPW